MEEAQKHINMGTQNLYSAAIYHLREDLFSLAEPIAIAIRFLSSLL
jgi:uncharacterized protein YciW